MEIKEQCIYLPGSIKRADEHLKKHSQKTLSIAFPSYLKCPPSCIRPSTQNKNPKRIICFMIP